MTRNKIELELNKLYELMVNSELYEQEKENQEKLKAMFLGEMDKIFGVPFEMFGHRLNYTYYYRNKKFLEINLLESPPIEDKAGFLSWFSEQLELAFVNLRNLMQ